MFFSDWENHELHWWRHRLLSGAAEDVRYHIELLRGLSEFFFEQASQPAFMSQQTNEKQSQHLGSVLRFEIEALSSSSHGLRLFCLLRVFLKSWHPAKRHQLAVLQFLIGIHIMLNIIDCSLAQELLALLFVASCMLAKILLYSYANGIAFGGTLPKLGNCYRHYQLHDSACYW